MSNRPLIGVQNSVIGWNDPFHPSTSEKYMRTGEGRHFPSQDPTPSAGEYMKLLRLFGVDFYMHHSIPCDSEIAEMIRILDRERMPFILGNEFYSINGPYAEGTKRGDYSPFIAEKAVSSDMFMGFLYDETEHRQIHSSIYRADIKGYEWTCPHNKDADRIETDIINEIGRVKNKYHGAQMFSEHVFPIMYHTFSRAGMNPCPKILKEEFCPLQLSVAMGAAKQYGRSFSICVDMWGFDVGNWFTRLWGFPAHSPAEFRSALELAWRLSPYMMFVENIDILARNTENGFRLTEFGNIFRSFINEYSSLDPPYSFNDIDCDIAVIRSDDCYISKSGNFGGSGMFGSDCLRPDEKSNSFIDVMHILLHKTSSDRALTYFNSEFNEWPAGAFPRNAETLKTLPLENGIGTGKEKTCHPIFHPSPSVLVFDQYVKPDDIAGAKIIILCGSRLASTTAGVIADSVRNGAKAVIPRYFIDAFVNNTDIFENITVVQNFCDNNFISVIAPFLQESDSWLARFGNKYLKIKNPSGDGRTLSFDYR